MHKCLPSVGIVAAQEGHPSPVLRDRAGSGNLSGKDTRARAREDQGGIIGDGGDRYETGISAKGQCAGGNGCVFGHINATRERGRAASDLVDGNAIGYV